MGVCQDYSSAGRNPFLPAELHIPDGEAHVMPDGRVYLYGSLDKDGDSFCSQEYRVVSSGDMLTWRVYDHASFTAGSVPASNKSGSKVHSSLSKVTCFDDLPAHIRAQLPESARTIPLEQIIAAIESHASAGLPRELRLYAPDAIHKDGRFYLYYCMSDDSEGVAVSNCPEGPFTYASTLPVSGIDPAVFVEDDGQAYYYWGQFQAKAAKLNADMISIDENSIVENILTEEEHHFHEGSSMRKRGGVYYYVFADVSRGKPTCLGYATSRSPLGPFTYQGVIIDSASCDPGSWNIHGSIEEVNGQWYVFYHRSCNNSEYLRRACAEPIFFDGNGLIPEVKMTSQGAGKPFAPGEVIPAGSACEVRGGAYIADSGELHLAANSSAVFRYVENEAVIHQLCVTAEGGGTLSILANGEVIGSGSAGSPIPVTLAPGLHEIELCMDAGSNLTVNSLLFE